MCIFSISAQLHSLLPLVSGLTVWRTWNTLREEGICQLYKSVSLFWQRSTQMGMNLPSLKKVPQWLRCEEINGSSSLLDKSLSCHQCQTSSHLSNLPARVRKEIFSERVRKILLWSHKIMFSSQQEDLSKSKIHSTTAMCIGRALIDSIQQFLQ